MPWPFDREYMQLALLTGLVVGACAPLIGTFLVQRHLSLMGEGMGHMAFAGVAAGALTDVWPVWTALGVAVVGAIGVEWLRSRGRASGDLALAVVFYGGLGGAAVILGLADSFDAGVLGYLFGSILTVTEDQLLVVAALGAVVVAVIGVAWRALFALAVDEEWASVAGLPVGALNYVLAVLVALTVVAAMRVVGLLLIGALMVLPVASAQVLARSQRGILTWASTIGVASVVVGLGMARAWGLAPGGTIVLVALGVFVVVMQVTALLRLRAAGTFSGILNGVGRVTGWQPSSTKR